MSQSARSRVSSDTIQEDGDYLASVSDLMSGLLFIFIIALMVFALGLRKKEIEAELAVKELTGAQAARTAMLMSLKAHLHDAGIEVEIDPQQGVLRLKEGILFESGSADLGPEGARVVASLARAFVEVLPCYTSREERQIAGNCPAESVGGFIDAILIEGHTDNVPTAATSRFSDNWELSTARAKRVYFALTLEQPNLDELQNQDGQAVLSLSGYAEKRGVAPNDTDENKRKNRRIDLRFVLQPPRDFLPEPARRIDELMSPK